ncbi:putative isochorismatase [Escherichia coli]|uniref:Putative isochorismatase n=1 Tax=Escherichia coli TaxID=562 RepID=A0A2X3LZD6_ECOLX|nr:putative isochorismatase [Escherichia coli]
MLELNAKTTALVVIDLQEGILPFAGGPHTADEVVNRAGKAGGEISRQRSARVSGARWLVCRLRRSIKTAG